MIDKKSRRVVIINNIQSDTIDQAIFILKSDKATEPSKSLDRDISLEAQKIIDNYINQVERLKKVQEPFSTRERNRHKPKRPSFFLPVTLTAGFMLAVFFLMIYFG
ncbi:MAG: hypothetical protein IJW15_03385 [Clostridia bacterium]|nr:hypothetical protein [Clostridia bacterium]